MPPQGKYKSAAVVAATKIPIETFNRWVDRRIIPLTSDDVPGDGRGKPRRYGLRTAKKLAIAYRISKLGIAPNIAVALATKFTDERQCDRRVGDLFPIGLTYILQTEKGCASVINVKPEDDISAMLQDAAIIVNVNQICGRPF